MVFSFEDKAIIKNDYLEKRWGAYKIWKEHPSKSWDRVSVWRLVKKFEMSGSMGRKEGSGRPVSATSAENMEAVEELVCSQEGEEGTHEPPRKIAEQLGVSHTSVRRMIKRRTISQFKLVNEPQRNNGTKERRFQRASSLAERV